MNVSKTYAIARWIFGLVFLLAVTAAAVAKGPRYPTLEPGVPVTGIIRPANERSRYRTYVVEVPPTATALRLRLIDASADLDIFLRHGEDMDDYADADFYSESEMWLEELHLYKAYETWFPPGRYFLDVVYQWNELPRRDGATYAEIPFTLIYEVFDTETISQDLDFGAVEEVILDDENGYLAHFTIEVPRGGDPFRIDVLDSPGDVDLFLSRDDPAPVRGDYEMIAETYLGRESLHVEPRHAGGKYFLTVLEASETEYPVPVRLTLTRGDDPPRSAPRPTVFRNRAAGPDGMRLATVQLISEAGIGSGCLVSSDGLIVTNHHVVTDDGGNNLPWIIVAVSTQAFEAPEEMFVAEVIRNSPEDDLALIRIVSDRWGRELPEDYRFPYWRLGDSGILKTGDPLFLMGYPWMGSGLSRSYFTLTRGILSGGEQTKRGLILKSDAVISGGSSGGAVSDGDWRLLGFPTFVVSDDTAQLTYFVPVSRIPRDWRQMFRYE